MDNENPGAILANAALTSSLMRTLIDNGSLTHDQAISTFQAAIRELEKMKRSTSKSRSTLDCALALLSSGEKSFQH